jgi:hypothetical protein
VRRDLLRVVHDDDAIFQPASPYLAKRFDRLKELAREREDPLSYAAASLEPGRSTLRAK